MKILLGESGPHIEGLEENDAYFFLMLDDERCCVIFGPRRTFQFIGQMNTIYLTGKARVAIGGIGEEMKEYVVSNGHLAISESKMAISGSVTFNGDSQETITLNPCEKQTVYNGVPVKKVIMLRPITIG